MLKYQGEKVTGRMFKVVADKWEQQHEKQVKYYTMVSYKKPLEDVHNKFDGFSIREITTQMIQNFINNYAEKTDDEGKHPARQTVNLRLVVVNLIFKHSIIKGDVDANPAQYVCLPKSLKKGFRDVASDEAINTINNKQKGRVSW